MFLIKLCFQPATRLEYAQAVSHWELTCGPRTPLGRPLHLSEANYNSCFLSELRAVIATHSLIAVKPNGQPRSIYPANILTLSSISHLPLSTQQVLPFQKGGANASSPSLILVSMHLIDGSPLGKQRQQIQVNGPEDWEALLSILTQPNPKHWHLQ